MRTVTVHTQRPYDIRIGAGILEAAGMLTRDVLKPCRVMLVSDDRVDGLFGQAVRASYEAAGFPVSRFVFPNGEASKNLDTLGSLLNAMARERITRSDLVVALGGGVVGDLAGFAAAAYARGMRFVQIPTTLLAAVDASVGGKTAVDLPAGKNLVGAFWQPSLVLCDTGVLKALPADLLRDGAAEIVKYGVLSAPELFGRMARGQLLETMDETVEACVRIKRDIVAEDERDTGNRQLLNLGHTFGHAVEACSAYTLSHGQSVAIGLAMMARASARMGMAEPGLVEAVEAALTANELPLASPYGADALLDAALLDKKRQGGSLTLIVPHAVGRCSLHAVPVEAVRTWIEAGMEEWTCG